MSVRSNLLQKFGVGVADQAVSSATNFVVSLAIARFTSPKDLGAFTLVFTAYLVALGINRSCCGEPLTVRYAGKPIQAWADGVRSSSGATLVVGCFFGAVLLTGARFLPTPFNSLSAILGFGLPGLLLQDTWRYAFFTQGQGTQALINDLVWTAFLTVTTAIVVLSDLLSLEALTACWVLGGNVAALIGLLQIGLAPQARRASDWWAETRHLSMPYLAEYAALTGAGQSVTFGIAALAGLSALGFLRTAQLALGPVTMLMMGVGLISLPEAVLRSDSKSLLVQWCIRVALALSAVVFCWGGLVLVVPTSWAEAIFGPIWSGARPVVPAVTLLFMASAISVGASTGLRALTAARSSLVSRLLASALLIGATLLGATQGLALAAWGMAIGALLGSLVWWTFLSRALRVFAGVRSAAMDPRAEGRP